MNYKFSIKINNLEMNCEIENFEGELQNLLRDIEGFFGSISSKILNMKYFGKIVPKKKVERITEEVENKEKEIKNIEDEFPEDVVLLAKDLQVFPDELYKIYDFDADKDLPPLFINIKQNNRAESQRTALFPILYYNSIVNSSKILTSYQIGDVLINSNIDHNESAKCITNSLDMDKYIKIEGKKYRITKLGIAEAKKRLRELIKNP